MSRLPDDEFYNTRGVSKDATTRIAQHSRPESPLSDRGLRRHHLTGSEFEIGGRNLFNRLALEDLV